MPGVSKNKVALWGIEPAPLVADKSTDGWRTAVTAWQVCTSSVVILLGKAPVLATIWFLEVINLVSVLLLQLVAVLKIVTQFGRFYLEHLYLPQIISDNNKN
jgi:hypothetical protein